MAGCDGQYAAVRRRRRYEVVVEGLYGQAAAQRSVISEHRSEAEARENAQLECQRLQVIYGDAASSWRIRVVRDGETVVELVPEGGGARRRSVEPLSAAPPVEEPPAAEDTPADPAPEGAGSGDAPAGDAEPAPAPEPEPVPAAGDEEDAREGESAGPVPDWLIARFEESIARQRERTYGASKHDDDPDDPRR